MRRILEYIVIASLLMSIGTDGFSQTKKVDSKAKNKIKADTLVWKGVTVEVDMASIIANNVKLLKSETQWYEGAMSGNIGNKYFPVVELGYASTSKNIANVGSYDCNGYYQRIGLDINLKKKSKEKSTNNIIAFGIRLGHSSFDYDYSNMSLTDNYWGGNTQLGFSQRTSSQYWYEVVFGIRVELFTNLYMGWSVRDKIRLSMDVANGINPWSIPGYGPTETDNNWQLNYTVGYSINWQPRHLSKLKDEIKTNK
jgi:Domain of unknown function (DUF6048)